MSRKAFVTGGGGFVGSHLCAELNMAGIEVHAVTRTLRPRHSDGVHWYNGDLTDYEAVSAMMREVRPDTVFHLAGYPVGDRGLGHVRPSFQSNLATTVNVLLAAAEFGCGRFVHAGSLEEPVGNGEEFPTSPYAASKFAASAYIRMFHELYSLTTVILRVFMVYGPGQRDTSKLIPYVITSFLRGEVPKLTSGTREVDWIYVKDVARAFVQAGEIATVESGTFDVGSGSLTSIKGVVDKIEQIMKPRMNPRFDALPDRPFERIRVADTELTRRSLGWKPQTSLEQGLELTIDWYEHFTGTS